ncbi:16S rRNA (cytidine(1402)-2'-O)-methyltransferase [Pseudomonadales bacterium]|nr:16S rRNA (cytidine(1402)-2'-O)-methyltransferase [Pseudomonadales bacterium]
MSSDNDPSSQGITPEIAVNTDTIKGSQYWPASTLYVVATPIGNLSDISARAVQVLQAVDLIAAEDTRHSSGLVKHLNVDTPMIACHDHNEAAACKSVLDRLTAGQCVALISDAGTPLISDPGYKIVKSVREQGFRVAPIPGACAVISALSAAGLPTDRFAFEGFLPAKAQARQKRLQQLADATSTLVFYEAPHRIVATLQAMAEVLGAKREAVLARELTKRYETIIDGTLDELAQQVDADRNQQRGEMVILVRGAASLADDRSAEEQEADRILTVLLAELPAKQASILAVKLTGLKKNYLYKRAIALSSQDE